MARQRRRRREEGRLDPVQFLVGGAFALILTFGATFTGAGLADDMQKNIVNRFRSLPMSRSAVVFGRTASDVIYNVLSLVVISGAGLICRMAHPQRHR